jgi:hypothetical protein
MLPYVNVVKLQKETRQNLQTSNIVGENALMLSHTSCLGTYAALKASSSTREPSNLDFRKRQSLTLRNNPSLP